MGRRILIFGGTFDPVHHGHLIVAQAIAERAPFDRVTFVPTASPPHKEPARAPGSDRLAMLRLACEGERGFEVSDIELRRQGPSYTVDTLAELRRLESPGAEFHLLLGADMLAELPNWHRAGELVALTRFVIAGRAPWPPPRMEELLASVRRRLGGEAARQLDCALAETPRIDVSSSDIRHRIAEGRSVRYLVPEAVRVYIAEHGLYRLPAPEGAGC